jgi:hypothetical protein
MTPRKCALMRSQARRALLEGRAPSRRLHPRHRSASG